MTTVKIDHGIDMGWLPWSSGKSSDPKPPARQDRQKCWESRDAYFACLDAAGVLKPGDEGKACESQRKTYEQSCAKSWVSCFYLSFALTDLLTAWLQIEYFNQRRVLAEQQKDQLAMANSQAEDARRRGR